MTGPVGRALASVPPGVDSDSELTSFYLKWLQWKPYLNELLPPYTMLQIISQAERPPSVIKSDPSGWQVCALMVLLYSLNGAISGLHSERLDCKAAIHKMFLQLACQYAQKLHASWMESTQSCQGHHTLLCKVPLRILQSSLRSAQLAVDPVLVISS